MTFRHLCVFHQRRYVTRPHHEQTFDSVTAHAQFAEGFPFLHGHSEECAGRRSLRTVCTGCIHLDRRHRCRPGKAWIHPQYQSQRRFRRLLHLPADRNIARNEHLSLRCLGAFPRRPHRSASLRPSNRARNRGRRTGLFCPQPLGSLWAR